MQSTESHCQTLSRDADRDRYLSALFAAPEARRGLFALYAFNVEIARVRDIVSDPLPGEIRLQWWRDAIEGSGHGDADQHPVLAELRWAIERYKLPVSAFTGLIDARIFDLYEDPMPTLADLEGYAGETSSALIQLASIILANGEDPATAEISGHAGVAYAMTGLMRALPLHASRRQVFLPKDILDRHGVSTESIFRGETTAELKAALVDLRGIAMDHLVKTRSMIGDLRPELVPAFLPVSLVEPLLGLLGKKGHDPLRDIAELSPLRRQWLLWRSWKKAAAGRR